jgi:RNA polymerase sigma factor (sigma-70 family)
MMDVNTLYNAVINGDICAERQLFEQLSESLRLLVKHKVYDANDAQELVQEIMMVISEKYRKTMIHTSFGAWVHMIYENKLKSYYRDKKRKGRLDRQYYDSKAGFTDVSVDLELRHRVVECLKKICRTTMAYARVLNFHYQGYNTKEIGRRLNITDKAIYNILFRARQAMKICIDEAKAGENGK